MRTTVTLDEDVARELERLQRERDISFKEAINSTLREGLGRKPRRRAYRIKARALGLRSGIDLDKALQLAAELEDQEIIRKLKLGR
jgi:predicted CopG family antitoxin